MAASECALPNPQRALGERPGLRVAAPLASDRGEPVEAIRQELVAWTQRAFPNA